MIQPGCFNPSSGPTGYLRGEAFTVDKHGGVDDGREPGIEEDLAAANHKRSILPGIASRLVNTI